MSTQKQDERVSVKDISSALRDADAAIQNFDVNKFLEKVRYAEALGKKYKHQEGL